EMLIGTDGVDRLATLRELLHDAVGLEPLEGAQKARLIFEQRRLGDRQPAHADVVEQWLQGGPDLGQGERPVCDTKQGESNEGVWRDRSDGVDAVADLQCYLLDSELRVGGLQCLSQRQQLTEADVDGAEPAALRAGVPDEEPYVLLLLGRTV